MAKSSVKQIKVDEKRILGVLAKNANKSINDIAKSLGFSRQKVWRVMNSLEKNNTIWGYVAVIDEEKVDKKSYILLVKRSTKPVEQELLNHIIKRELVKRTETKIDITNSMFTHGSYDWIIYFNAYDLKQAKQFQEHFNKLYEGFIIETQLIEKLFTVVSCGVTNPEIKKLNDFFKI